MVFSEEINLDLSTNTRTEIPIQVEWEIDIPEPVGAFKQFFFKKYGKLEKEVTLAITDINVDDRLVLKSEAQNLVFLRSEGEHGSMLRIKLKERKTYCRVVIDPKEIADCKERELHFSQRKPYPVSFNIVLSDNSGNTIESHEVTVNVNLTPVHIEPNVKLSLEESITYSSSAELVEIGSINVSNTEPNLRFTPAINVDLTVTVRLNENLIPVNAIHVGDENGSAKMSIKDLVPSDSRYGHNNYMVVPIYLDMCMLKNPLLSKEPLTVAVEWSYHRTNNPAECHTGKRDIEILDFLQDAQGAELIVSHLEDGNTKTRIHNGQSIYMPEICFYAHGSTVLDRCFRLANLATDCSRVGAGVKVRNLQISEKIEGGYLKAKNDITVEEVFDKSNSGIARLNEGYELRNGKDSFTVFTLTFDPGKVLTAVGTSDFRLESILTIEFDYYENPNGKSYSEIALQHFKFTLIQPLHLLPNPHWLCIDYGSSAIVCKYSDTLLNLHERKKSILKKALTRKNQSTYLDNDKFEEGTPFLSSDILLHTPIETEKNTNVSSLCSEQSDHSEEQYDKLAVFLSPTSPMVINEFERQLPCLKLLMGNALLSAKTSYQTFNYDILDSDKRVQNVKSDAMCESRPDKSLMVIDTIFRESYEALLRYFIIPEVKDINLINRLVLTYPNTYTPRHLETLRNIVKKTMPAVRELEFVSESDAVAAYYLENWTKYHLPGADPLVNETILVYDMGAGTLDLSLIKKTVAPDGTIRMEIVAKIGTPKAGNYLDFVLADIVCKLIGASGKGRMALASTQTAANGDIGKERSELKNFVKNVLKPQLSQKKRNTKLRFESVIDEKYDSFSIDQVLNHELLETFLKEVSYDILAHLTKFVGVNTPIDTVLMSGRSSLFEPLQDRLKESVRSFCRNDINFIRLDNPYFVEADATRSKLAVTEGAMAIMMRNYRKENSQRQIVSKSIYASFGVAYQDFGRWHYVELLSYKDIPVGQKGEHKGKPITLPNLNNISSLLVLQTYLDATETEDALNTGKWDYIAEMERISLSGQSSESLMMKITDDNNVLLYIGQQRTRGQAPKGDDLSGEAIKRSLWPVTI